MTGRHRRPAAPPRGARAFLGLLLPGRHRRFALADLDEEFHERVQRQGAARARVWYRAQVVRSVRPLVADRVVGAWRRVTARRSGVGSEERERHMGGVVERFLMDLRYGLRTLRRSPVTVTVTVLSLGFGIGAVTAAFAVVDSLLLRPPTGLAEPERLVTLYTSESEARPYGLTSFPDFRDMEADLEALGDAAASSVRTLTLEADGSAQALFGEETTDDYFSLLGIRPALGRAFLPGDARVGDPARVAVMGHDLWSSRFGADPGVVGRTVRLNGLDFTVLGVAPDGVTSRRGIPLEPDVWIPLGSADPPGGNRARALDDRGLRRFTVLGRLAQGAGLTEVQAQAEVLARRLQEAYPEHWTGDRDRPVTVTVVAERASRVRPNARAILGGVGLFFVGTAGLILLIACTNVASLFLARASQRAREMAVRASLGAPRRRLISMLMAEALVPGVLAGALGVLVAAWVVAAVNGAQLPLNLPIRLSVDIGLRTLAFAALAAGLGTLAFGLLPALTASRTRLVPALKGDDVGPGGRRFSGRRALVVIQCAASLVLLVGATLFVRALGSAMDTDLGLDPEGIAVASVTLDPAEYDPAAGLEELRRIQAGIAARPGVEQVELSRSLELTLLQVGTVVELTVDGEDPGPEGHPAYFHNSVTPGYLDLMGIPLLRGRGLAETDVEGAVPVAVVNQTLAERFWPGREPLGQQFTMVDPMAGRHGLEPRPRTLQVVGVVADGKYGDYDDPPLPYFWTSLYQDYASTAAVSVRGAGGAEAMVGVLRSDLPPRPGQVQLLPPSTLESQVAIQFIHLRIASRVLRWGGLFGLFLAALGIYGIVSFAVARRTREMAVRMALGAGARRVLRTVAMDGVRLALAGLVVGLAVIVPVSLALERALPGLRPLDPVAFGAALALLLAVAWVASLLPARRAVRVDPMRTLREE